MNLSTFQLYSWIAMILLEFIILGIVIAKRLHHEALAFAVFLGFCCLRSTALLTISRIGSHAAYFYTYYAAEILELMLLIVLIYQLLAGTFQPWAATPRHIILCYCGATIAIAIGVGILAALNPSTYPLHMEAICKTIQRSDLLFIFSSMGLVRLLSAYTAVPLRRIDKVISDGFLVGLPVMITVTWVNAFNLFNVTRFTKTVVILSFVIQEVIWLSGLIRLRSERSVTFNLAELERAEATLRESQSRIRCELSSMPVFEGTTKDQD